MYDRDKTKLETALKPSPEKSTFNFAIGNIVSNNYSVDNAPTVFCVEGIGRISIPVSMKVFTDLATFVDQLNFCL